MPGSVSLSKEGKPKSAIPEELRPENIRVLCVYGDAGWGRVVAQCKYQTGHVKGDFVRAYAALIRDRWHPRSAPECITCVAWIVKPLLVPDFAQQLAVELGLPFLPVIEKIRETGAAKAHGEQCAAASQSGSISVNRDTLAAPVIHQ